MTEDARAIRNVISTWMRASAEGDTQTVLDLMADEGRGSANCTVEDHLFNKYLQFRALSEGNPLKQREGLMRNSGMVPLVEAPDYRTAPRIQH